MIKVSTLILNLHMQITFFIFRNAYHNNNFVSSCFSWYVSKWRRIIFINWSVLSLKDCFNWYIFIVKY